MRLNSYRQFQRHFLVGKHDVCFGDHAQQLLLISAGDHGKIGQVELAHALHHFVHRLIGKGVLEVARVYGRDLHMSSLTSFDFGEIGHADDTSQFTVLIEYRQCEYFPSEHDLLNRFQRVLRRHCRNVIHDLRNPHARKNVQRRATILSLFPELKEKNSDLEKKNQAAEAKNDERVSIGGQFRLPNWIESEWGL